MTMTAHEPDMSAIPAEISSVPRYSGLRTSA